MPSSVDNGVGFRSRSAGELLVLKVLSLLQDGDRALAREIASSREALWSLLADPRTFATARMEGRAAPVSISGTRLVTAVALTTIAAAPAAAAPDPPVRQDLAAVIALHGLPCGQVVGVTRLGDNEYLASCSDGNRYRIFVSPEGRVVVQKQ